MTKKLIFTFCLISLCSGIFFVVLTEPVMADVKLTNPLGITDIPTLVGRIIKAALGIVGSIALLMFIYGGFTWLTSSGNPERVKKGRDVLVWATIGLIVIFVSYAAVDFVIGSLTDNTEETTEEDGGELKPLPEELEE